MLNFRAYQLNLPIVGTSGAAVIKDNSVGNGVVESIANSTYYHICLLLPCY
jgi:hypothetical protein